MTTSHPSASSLVAEWSRLLFGCLQRAGARDVIVSPGSRSTPFAWAALRTEGLRIHSVVDERSAGFFALGLARVSDAPPLLLCTSGTAAANYFPAVVEASLAALPLLVLSADRPFELQQAGAPQTIDQLKLYGDHARAFFDLAAPTPERASFAALARIADQACFRARFPEPGPVHLNCRAKKPLEPSEPVADPERELAALVDALLERRAWPTLPPLTVPNAETTARLAAWLARCERPLIVCGPLDAKHAGATRQALAELADALEAPVFAEATSQMRFGAARGADADGLGWLFASERARAALAPDLVLSVGAPLTSGASDRLFSGAEAAELHVIAEHGYPDPLNAAQSVSIGSVRETARALARSLEASGKSDVRRAYRARFAAANGRVWSAVEAELGAAFGEAECVKSALRTLPDGATLMLGNSLPVREVDAYARADARVFKVVHQRGANGIDGLISGAAGAAIASEAPTLLVLGDVSFAHDLGGLALLRNVATPVAVLVIDNDGGRIFEHLPVSKLFTPEGPDAFERLFLTSPGLAVEHAGPLFGLRYVAPLDAATLERELRAALGAPGATLVHVRVPGHSARDTKQRIERAIDAIFEATPP